MTSTSKHHFNGSLGVEDTYGVYRVAYDKQAYMHTKSVRSDHERIHLKLPSPIWQRHKVLPADQTGEYTELRSYKRLEIQI